jgi:hypothetical protein
VAVWGLLGAAVLVFSVASGGAAACSTTVSASAAFAGSGEPVPVTGQQRLGFGAFAGYIRIGPLRSIAGSWRVPGVLHGSNPGRAATWVGAQAPAKAEPFIQVGTNEECERTAAGGTVEYYYAFWSDTTRDFHPQFLFAVSPGDAISASMHLRRGRWELAISDATSGRRSRFATSQEASIRFNLAEWLQEDITSAHLGRPFPYPRTRTVTISHLLVNSADPTYAAVQSQWMSENHQSLGPGPLRDDSFSLMPMLVSAAGRRYLQLARREDAAQARFTVQATGWSSSTPIAIVSAQRAGLGRELARSLAGLSSPRWPAGAQPLVDRLVRAERALRAQTDATPTLTRTGLAAWIGRWLGEADVLGRTGHQVRRALGIPQFT